MIPGFVSLAVTPTVPAGSLDLGADPVGSSAPTSPAHQSVSTPTASRPITRPTTSLQHAIQKPKVYMDGLVWYGPLDTTSEPSSLQYALIKNKTWHLVPHGIKNIVGCRWGFKVWRKANDTLEQYKVVRG